VRRRRPEEGSVVVEFALLLPILFLVLLAAVQVGLLARDQLVLAQASRAGAREAAVTLDAQVVHDTAVAAAAGLDPGRVRVVVLREGTQGDPVTVEVAYLATVAAPLAGWLLPATVELRARATMRQEVA
jgi:type IV pilus biogenesis protein CpaD/CtpE